MQTDPKLLEKNPRIDVAVVERFRALQDRLPAALQQRQGADYHISPPLGGSAFAKTDR
jgi:hypothetical protein